MLLKKSFFYLLAFFTLSYIVFSPDSEVKLSEIVACNHSVIYDNTGAFHDYIELYNNSNSQIDISGYALSDSKKQLNKFIFPENTFIKPKQYYLVWAAKKPYNILVDNNYLYTGFALRNGEKVYLSNKEGKILDKIKIPKNTLCDVSYSRIPQLNKWAKREPTPGKQNKLYKSRNPEILHDISVRFDKASGFYDKPFKLKMSAPEGFDIYYTLDASRPNKKSIKYMKPIEIRDASSNPNKYSAIDGISIGEPYIPDFPVDKATVVRAVAVRQKDGAISEIMNASYFVGFQNKKEYQDISVVSIITDPENLFDYEKGIYVTGKLWDIVGNGKDFHCSLITANSSARGKDWARDMHIDYIEAEKTSHFSGKIKIQGGCSRYMAQKNFTLLDIKKANTNIPIPEFNLRAVNTASRIKESLIHTLTSNRPEIFPHPHTNIVNVFLDGEYWGMYFIYEQITPNFFIRKTPLKDFSLIDLQRNLKQYGTTWFQEVYRNDEEIEQNIDIDSLISYVSINTYISNMDSCNLDTWNTIRWRSSENQMFNKWHWMLSDLDYYIKFDINQNQFKEDETCNLIVGNKLLENLFSYESFKKKFIITFEDIANYNFDPKKVKQYLDAFEKKYTDTFILTFRRFRQHDFSKKNYIGRINKIRNFFNHRFEYIIPYMKEYFNLQGDLVEVHKVPSKINGGEVIINTIRLMGDEDYVGKYYSDYDISLDVETFPGYVFKGWLIDDKPVQTQKLDLSIHTPRKIEAVWDVENPPLKKIKSIR